ncbi:phosphoribosylformylglycinamidine synthase subunit PurL [Cyanobacterium stanieri LEGE 03274]|uniref:Phosphoribosylformylglycinamidine synthase subunit PurL n=1 Tax=Cyanobacterium stanieri LEGE 03274 TaxID=1828756 RepID=A0ABR9V1F3_9CHRO|nr:phosphoribosylformylglycinamidine synthase subunit PurL [Cyanobacterium stanieri]MBE9221379.1 phosphoribosylformylglycinamidine synthase subunit PurL [Cyanobacterium stanieri LEGE 03274]
MSAPFTPEEIASEGLKPSEYEDIVQRLGRHPNRAELGMFGVMWSEHCCYKNSRPLLSQFPTTGERILVGPGENAGVVDFGDGLQVAFKIESHNHPSAIEPFQGAATGVGGILRDIFTMGARPIAILNSLRFGNLDNPHTKRIFQGVVEGISHYGNCLIAEETLIWRDEKGIHFDTIGNFVEKHLSDTHEDTLELQKSIETLSFNQETQETTWQPIRRIYKRFTNQLITLKTALGRKITLTPDHPQLVAQNGQWQIKDAKELQKGDLIPLLLNLPFNEAKTEDLNLISLLGEEFNDVYVDFPDHWCELQTEVLKRKLKEIEPNAEPRHRYLTQGYLPINLYRQLESLVNIEPSELRLYRRSGKANYMKAVLKIDEDFARLLGYYLSEGCVSQNGNTYKIIFTFGLHEKEYVEDVINLIEKLGLKACIEERKSTFAVYTTSWLLGHLLKEVWQCGHKAPLKAFPDCFFSWSPTLQEEGLKGLLRGDGSLTTKTTGNHAKIGFATTSQKLFEQTIFLLQNLGVVPYIYRKPAQISTIEGRQCESLPLWQLEINNVDNLAKFVKIFSEERNQQLVSALEKYQGNQHSFPRYHVSNQVAFVKIKDIEVQEVENYPVYDIEVDNTHLFVTTSGIITHNCIGVPTVGGEVYFNSAYKGNPLVNAMAIGLMETETIVKSGASGVGNPVLYVGSTTGRDGMGGASFASAELTDDSMDDRPAVQVGDPFLEKSLVEACLEAFKTGAVVAAQDMGAAGITCSTSEMAAKGGLGIELDLDKIPARETGMIPYEYLLSESQERMLFVAQKGREQELIDIFERWGLHAVVAGEVIEEQIVRILHQGSIAAEVPSTALADNTPVYHHELLSEAPEYAQKAWAWHEKELPECDENGVKGQKWSEVLLTLLDQPTIASKRWIYRQYDHQVQNNTVMLPGGADAAIIRVRPVNGKPQLAKTGIAATTDCNPRYVYLDPYVGASLAVAEAARNLSCVGAQPIAVTDNLNFGSPEKPIGYWQLHHACSGISEACRQFETPVTGGNVSLYNETVDSEGNPQPIYPTPVIGMVGLIPDISKIAGQGWQQEGDLIYFLGAFNPSLGASEYLATIHDTIAGKPPALDFDLEKAVQKACREGIRHGLVKSAHDCAEGGLTVALAECCIGGSLGAVVNVPAFAGRLDTALFGELASAIIVSVSPDNKEAWEHFLTDNLPNNWQEIGSVKGDSLQVNSSSISLVNLNLTTMVDTWEGAIARRL